MDEPLLGTGPLAVEVDLDARVATVRAQLPGPAGTAGLDLGGAIELDIDVARPATLAGLTIDLPMTGDVHRLPRSVRRRLVALLGEARSDEVATAVRAAGPGEGRPWPLGGQGRAGLSASLQRAALAHAAASEAAAPLVVQATGLIEAAVALDSLASSGLLDLRATARHDAQVGGELLAHLAARRPLALPGPHAAAALAGLLRSLSPLLDDGSAPARALAALTEAIDRGDHTGHSAHTGRAGCADRSSRDERAARAAPGAAAAAAGLVRRVLVDVRALPGALAGAAISARRSTASEIEVRIDGWADRRHGLWARVFDARDDTLIGLAPFKRDPASAADTVARLIVPPDGGPHGRRFEVDVTDRPEMPRPSPTLAAVERARHQGARAARAERLGDRPQARHRWLTCARLWAAAGEPVRAGQARALAAEGRIPGQEDDGGGGGSAGDIGPLVCDLVSPG